MKYISVACISNASTKVINFMVSCKNIIVFFRHYGLDCCVRKSYLRCGKSSFCCMRKLCLLYEKIVSVI